MNEMAIKRPVIQESMRIGGRKVETPDVVEVRYPYTNEVIGTVPAGTAEHAREAFEIAAGYTPTLTRYERQQILFRAGELIRETPRVDSRCADARARHLQAALALRDRAVL